MSLLRHWNSTTTHSLVQQTLPRAVSYLRDRTGHAHLNITLARATDIRQWIDTPARLPEESYFNWHQCFEQIQENSYAQAYDALIAVSDEEVLCALAYYRYMPGGEYFHIMQSESMGRNNLLAGQVGYIYMQTAMMCARAAGVDKLKATGPFYLTEKQLERCMQQGFRYNEDGDMVLDIPPWATGLKRSLFAKIPVVGPSVEISHA